MGRHLQNFLCEFATPIIFQIFRPAQVVEKLFLWIHWKNSLSRKLLSSGIKDAIKTKSAQMLFIANFQVSETHQRLVVELDDIQDSPECEQTERGKLFCYG